jgi:hypothetical protein
MMAQEADAVSQTPADRGKGMQVFFDPSQAPCGALSILNPKAGDKGVLNQAILFHEALHGYTGLYDTALEGRLPGLVVGFGGSIQITDYLENNVIFPGPPYGAATCGN